MSLKKALLAATVLSLPIAAQAQPVTGLYIAGGGGYNFQQESRGTVNGSAGTALAAAGIGNGVRTEFDNGWVALGSIGYGFGNGLRVEAEGNYRENDIDDVRVGGVSTFLRGGRSRTYGAMGNVLFDFVIPGIPVMPYVGGGVGYAWHEYDGVRGRRTGAGNVQRTIDIDDSDGSFAYQGIVGVAFPLGVPGLALTAEYRYFGTLSPDLNTRVRANNVPGASVSSGTVLGTGRYDADNQNHSALIGIRYAFNAPRPAVIVAPPAVVQGVARTYLVFFDWDRADLTDRARQIIAEAAAASRNTATTRIEVAGHADRSGTPQYNQRLSQRRAEVVAAELARNGVARSAISISAFGESRPLVPTADGVREPQNRRVEIVLR